MMRAPAKTFSYAALLMALTIAFASAGTAVALDQAALRGSLFGANPAAPSPASSQPIARFVSQEGETFVLDRSQARPLMKFDDSPEVWVLRPQVAPRGDVIYMNDLDEPVLRATRLGRSP